MIVKRNNRSSHYYTIILDKVIESKCNMNIDHYLYDRMTYLPFQVIHHHPKRNDIMQYISRNKINSTRSDNGQLYMFPTTKDILNLSIITNSYFSVGNDNLLAVSNDFTLEEALSYIEDIKGAEPKTESSTIDDSKQRWNVDHVPDVDSSDSGFIKCKAIAQDFANSIRRNIYFHYENYYDINTQGNDIVEINVSPAIPLHVYPNGMPDGMSHSLNRAKRTLSLFGECIVWPDIPIKELNKFYSIIIVDGIAVALFNRAEVYITARANGKEAINLRILSTILPIVAKYYKKIPLRTVRSKTRELRDITKIAGKLMSMIKEQYSSFIQATRDRLVTTTSDIDSAIQRLRSATKEAEILTKQLEVVDSPELFEKEITQKVQKTIDGLSKFKNIKSVTINEKTKSLVVITEKLIATDSITKNKHMLGSCAIMIKLDPTGYTESIRVKSLESQFSHISLPHILGGGKICTGTGSSAIIGALCQQDYAAVVAMVISILTQPNMSDGAGRHILYFPVVRNSKKGE